MLRISMQYYLFIHNTITGIHTASFNRYFWRTLIIWHTNDNTSSFVRSFITTFRLSVWFACRC